MSDTLARSLRDATRTPSAFTGVYEATARELLAFFVRRTFDIEVARDLMAETYAQAFEHRRRFRGRTDAEAAAWLYGIARHLLSRYVRKGVVERRAVRRLALDVPDVSEDDHRRIIELAGLAGLREAVAGAFSTLPVDQREAVRLRIIDERAYQEVAAALDISEQTARARVARALRRIAAMTEVSRPAEVNR